MWLRLDPAEGHEQAGQRPVLVVSYEPFHRSGLMTVVPITSARTEPRLPGDVALAAGQAGLPRAGVAICSQVRTISILRVAAARRPLYVEESTTRAQVRAALGRHLGLDIPPETDGAG